MITNPVHGALFGVAIGDALGVPADWQACITGLIPFPKNGAMRLKEVMI